MKKPKKVSPTRRPLKMESREVTVGKVEKDLIKPIKIQRFLKSLEEYLSIPEEEFFIFRMPGQEYSQELWLSEVKEIARIYGYLIFESADPGSRFNGHRWEFRRGSALHLNKYSTSGRMPKPITSIYPEGPSSDSGEITFNGS